jgi:hypothetical protein
MLNVRPEATVVFRVVAFRRRTAETASEAPDTLGFREQAGGPLTGPWDFPSPTLIVRPKVPLAAKTLRAFRDVAKGAKRLL